MNDMAVETDTREIVVEEVLPFAPTAVWKALTTGEVISRWLMEPTGFAPVTGNQFTFQTTPAGKWDGTIHCEVLDVVPNERFAFAWRGGDADNVGYGSRLDTVVTWTLAPAPGGTLLRLVHSGFELPRNETAFKNMGEGWPKVLERLRPLPDGQE